MVVGDLLVHLMGHCGIGRVLYLGFGGLGMGKISIRYLGYGNCDGYAYVIYDLV